MNKCYECGRECLDVVCVECLEKYLAEQQAENEYLDEQHRAEFGCPGCGSLLGACYSGCPLS